MTKFEYYLENKVTANKYYSIGITSIRFQNE